MSDLPLFKTEKDEEIERLEEENEKRLTYMADDYLRIKELENKLNKIENLVNDCLKSFSLCNELEIIEELENKLKEIRRTI